MEYNSDVGKNLPRFLIAECLSEGPDLTKLSPFELSIPSYSIPGEAEDIKKLRSRQLLVEVNKPVQSAKLLKANVLIDNNIKVDAHRSLNTCKGVIRSRYLLSCTEEEILGEFKDQSVTSVRRICIFRDGQKRLTATLILTFDSSKVPCLAK